MSQLDNEKSVTPVTGQEMTLHCSEFELPESPLLSDATRQALRLQAAEQKAALEAQTGSPQSSPSREELREQFYRTEGYQRLRSRYPVDIKTELMGGVLVETITPLSGVAKNNEQCVLINFHGGSFEFGSRTNSLLESVPVAALGQIKVVSVDYRMYPEHHHPAALEDAFAVYQELLNTYAPENIGVFGSSAGAQLAAQLIYRLLDKKLGLPAAVAMIALGATKLEGDSLAFIAPVFKAQTGEDLIEAITMGYFDGADMDDPQVHPALLDDCMAQFPPSFLASSTRDLSLSPVVVTHRKLVQQGIEAELHIWEGLDHYFHGADIELVETKDLHVTMLRFFDRKFSNYVKGN